MKGQEARDCRAVFNQEFYESYIGGHISLALRMGL